jgi:hypothetical protein
MTRFLMTLAAVAALAAACSGAGGTMDAGTDAGSGTGAIGAACIGNGDCESTLFCSTDDPGGQCLKGCTVASDCPAGSVCTDEGKCYKSCMVAADCTRSAYECVDANQIDGGPTATCDVALSPDAGNIGDGCTVNSECTPGLFCSTDDPRGQCLSTCSLTTACPAGSVCTDESKCYKSCTVPGDCTRLGYACIDATVIDGGSTKTCDVP